MSIQQINMSQPAFRGISTNLAPASSEAKTKSFTTDPQKMNAAMDSIANIAKAEINMKSGRPSMKRLVIVPIKEGDFYVDYLNAEVQKKDSTDVVAKDGSRYSLNKGDSFVCLNEVEKQKCYNFGAHGAFTTSGIDNYRDDRPLMLETKD